MRFKKIKYDGSTVTLEQVDAGEKWERAETTASREAPHPDFVQALAALAPHVLALCELPDDYAEGLRVQSVSFSEDSDGNRGAVVTSLKTLTGVAAPLVLNTPHVSEREGADGRASMSSRFADALDAVELEARAFVTGKRAQADLFDGAGLSSVTITTGDQSVTVTGEQFARATAGV